MSNRPDLRHLRLVSNGPKRLRPKEEVRLLCPICRNGGGINGSGISSGEFLVEYDRVGVDEATMKLRLPKNGKTGRMYCKHCLAEGRGGLHGERGLIAEHICGEWRMVVIE